MDKAGAKIYSARMNIVITGVTRGLGRALAEAFITDGHAIFGCGRNVSAIESLKSDYPQHHWSSLDITDAEGLKQWAADVAKETPIDLVIQNAAILLDPQPLHEVKEADFRKILEVNVLGPHLVTRAFLPHLLSRGQGMIIYLSSGAGRMGLPSIGAYCTSKWAVEGYAKSLAAELPAGIAAVPLSPGMVNTDMLRQSYPDTASDHQSPEIWAKAAVPYILSLRPHQSGESLTTP